MTIKAIFASVQDIGKTVKKTKKHYVWKFNIDGRDHILELFTSMISGKKKIMIDGRIIFEGQKVLSSNFTYPIEVDRQTVNIYQHGEKYDVLINGQPFAQLYAGQGRDYGYDDVNSHGHSYGFSKSVTSKMGDKYNKDKGLRNNLERDEYATRAKYDGNKYYTNDEKIDSWNDVDRKMSHRRREEQHGYSERSDSAEDREENYTDFSRHPITKSKTFGATNNFQESENRQRHAHHHNSKSQMSRPSSHFENQGSFDNFSGFDKENQPAPPNRIQQKGFTQPPKNSNTQDFFDLDTAEKRTEQPKSQTQTVNHQDFFNFGNTSTTSTVQQKEEPKPAPPTIHKQHSMPAPVTTNDLIDFGGPNLSTITELYKLSPQTNQTIEFPTSTTTTVNAVNTASINNAVQLKTEPEKPKSDPAKKGDLWSSDLVSLGDIGNKPQSNNNKQPEFIHFAIPQAGSNNMSTNNNMSNMNTMNMMNNNMGMMNSMNMNNMGMMNTNFGQPNMMPGMGFNTNMGMGMGMNMGGYGNMGMNQGIGMGMGGMYNGYVNNANYF